MTKCIKFMRTPMLNPDTVEEVDIQILYPHEVFAAMYASHPDQFEARMLGGDPSKLVAFWDNMDMHPSLAGHPMTSATDWKQRCIPLQLHGDGVPISGLGKAWSKSVEVYSWASLLASASTAMTQILICLFHKVLLAKSGGQDSMTTFWKHLAWSFKWLMLGLWPDADADGAVFQKGSVGWRLHHKQKQLANGWRGVLWCLKGDLEYFALSLGLEHFSSNKPCFLCPCDSDRYPWTDCRPTEARWLHSIWTPTTWPKRNLPKNVILELPGISITNVMPDLLHIKHLGTDSWFYGSVMALLVKKILPGTASQNLERVWASIVECYASMDIPCRYSTLKDTMFLASNGFPKLKGTASAIRFFVKPLAATFEKFMDATNDDHRLVLLGLRMSEKFETILQAHSHEFRLPREAHEEPCQNGSGFTSWNFCVCATCCGN